MEMKIVNRVLLLNITIQLYKQEIWSCDSSHTLIFASQYQLLDENIIILMLIGQTAKQQS